MVVLINEMKNLFLEMVLKIGDDCDMLCFSSNFSYFFLGCNDISCRFFFDVFYWLFFNGDV